ncbi:hypothetical protein BV25DRAFT_1827108 [Artomyces pyxidatus]|uniref:Uncharacterized protein n=1 Tax=Artomyces pyxidatus TaxID=48021 RepID=A0ACB8SZ43_9AGAM|nr:hypothetical protein BV25DRAFT_1827108 [Artomyces pyxidatus]
MWHTSLHWTSTETIVGLPASAMEVNRVPDGSLNARGETLSYLATVYFQEHTLSQLFWPAHLKCRIAVAQSRKRKDSERLLRYVSIQDTRERLRIPIKDLQPLDGVDYDDFEALFRRSSDRGP